MSTRNLPLFTEAFLSLGQRITEIHPAHPEKVSSGGAPVWQILFMYINSYFLDIIAYSDSY